MSLRSRSTIIRFSARFFPSRRQPAAQRQRPRAGSASRGAVPFIGRASMPPAPSSAKNSSGERESSVAPGSATSAPWPTGWPAASAACSPAGSPRQRPAHRKGQVRLIDVARPDVVRHPGEGRARSPRRVPERPEPPSAAPRRAAGATAPGAPKTPNAEQRQPPPDGIRARAAARRHSRARRPAKPATQAPPRQRRVQRRQRRRHLAASRATTIADGPAKRAGAPPGP